MRLPAGLDWSLCRSFLAVMHDGSLSAAARALGLTQPTLGRHIAEMETALKTKLFTRSQHGLMPTPAARDLVPHAEAMASACEALVRAASGQAETGSGVVRLTASEFIGVEVLPDMLARFRGLHSEIEIELAVTNRQEDLLRREADIAVRMVRPRQSALVARRIGRVSIGLYAHRRYIARFGLPASAGELARHALIGFDRDDSGHRGLDVGRHLTRDLFAFRTDSDAAQLAALRAGVGIGGCQVPVARRNADLVAVLPDELIFGLDIWLVMHEDLRGSRRVRLLYDHLAAELSDYVAAGSSERDSRANARRSPKTRISPRAQ